MGKSTRGADKENLRLLKQLLENSLPTGIDDGDPPPVKMIVMLHKATPSQLQGLLLATIAELRRRRID